MKKLRTKCDSFLNYLKKTSWGDDCRGLMADERGFASGFSLILVTSIVCLGSLVGLGVVRNHVAQELGDLAVALDNVDQSFQATVFVGPGKRPCYHAFFEDDAATLVDPPDAAPACLNLSNPPSGEDGNFNQPSGIFP